MFRRRRSTSRHQPLSTASSQSAQSAATHAFLKSQPSSSSLSTAAAAAALRSLTPTPTPVENVQTKRMIQRRASITSQTSMSTGLRLANRTDLRRVNSSSSMRTRTFRDQSPCRPATSTGQVDFVPPLPSMPPEFSGRRNTNRRSVSLEPSMRLSSSPKQKPPGRGMSVDRSLRASASQSPLQSKPLSVVPELERSASRNSINFSYPMTSRPTSPATSRQFPIRDILATASLDHELSPASSPNARVAKNLTVKKATGLVPGSPRRSASSNGAAVAAAQAAIVPKMDETNLSPNVARSVRYRGHNQEYRQTSPRTAIAKHPPTVPEDYQGEELAVGDTGSQIDYVRTGSVSPINEQVSKGSEYVYAAEPSIIRTPATPEEKDGFQPTYPDHTPESNDSARLGHELQQSFNRHISSSPGRFAHFSSQIAVTGNGEHQPPPRSVSPVKSALKNARKSSLSPDGRDGSILRPCPPLSEHSDATSVASDEGSRLGYRRKPVKVSFDDDTEIVGDAASPPTSLEDMTPETPEKLKPKTGWLGVSKRKTSHLDTAAPDEFDEVLKPRPALPSFGSIRGTREDQPVSTRPELSDNESIASSESDAVVSGWSFSNDHAIRGILSESPLADSQPGTELDNIPPPELSKDAGSQPNAKMGTENGPVAELNSQVTYAKKSSTSVAHLMQEQGLSPSPDMGLTLQGMADRAVSAEVEKGRSSLECYNVPGGYPRTSLELDPRTTKTTNRKKNKKKARGKQAGEHIPTEKESGDESGGSVYSDAEEAVEGDGFGSINAIVDSRKMQGKDSRPVDVLRLNKNSAADTTREVQVQPIRPANRLEDHQDGRTMAAQEAAIQKAPESPSSPPEPLPFSSPYPPYPAQSTTQGKFTERDVVNSSMPSSKEKLSMSAVIYGDSGLRNTATMNSSSPIASSNGSSALRRAGSERVKKKPVSFGPVIQKEIGIVPDGDRSVNGRGSYIHRRRMSNGSDSSSSFVRSSSRPRKDERHTMRRTLRGGPPTRATQPSAVRPLSPPDETRSLSSGSGTGTMRTTLRGGGTKNEKASILSPSRSPKSKVSKVSRTRFVSRFPDSDDEDTGFRQRRLQRRYDDSSDDEEGRVIQTLRPVRGIPRRQGMHDGDSTELEDSSDNERLATPAPAAVSRPNRLSRDPGLAAVAKSRGMTEEELEEFLHRPTKGRMSGILDRLTMKKSKRPMDRRISKSNLGDPGQERGEPFLNASRGSTVTTVTANNPDPPPLKLTKGGSKKMADDSWPLDSRRKEPEVANAGTATEQRKSAPRSTSSRTEQQHPPAAGVSQSGSASSAFRNESAAKDTANHRQSAPVERQPLPSTNDTNGLSVMDVVFPQGGRKKRFPLLRKAFGMRS